MYLLSSISYHLSVHNFACVVVKICLIYSPEEPCGNVSIVTPPINANKDLFKGTKD